MLIVNIFLALWYVARMKKNNPAYQAAPADDTRLCQSCDPKRLKRIRGVLKGVNGNSIISTDLFLSIQ